MALHLSVIPRSSQDGGWVKFPTMGLVVDVKIPPHVCLTKSNSPRLADMSILGQTIDKCIKSNKNVRNVLVGNSKFWNLGSFKFSFHELDSHIATSTLIINFSEKFA